MATLGRGRRPYGCVKCLMVLVFCILLAPATWAGSGRCGSASPTIQQGRSPFAEMQVRDLTAAEEKALEGLLKSLAGLWKGDGEDTDCRGSDDTAVEEKEALTLDAEAEYDSDGSLRIETDVRSPSQHTRHSEILTLYLADKKLRVDNDSGAGDVELVEAGSSRIRYVKRGIILRSGGGASLRQELFVVLNAGRSDFSIETLVFIQGKFAGSKVRRYRR